MSNFVEFERQVQTLEGAPFKSTVFGSPFENLKGFERTITNFRSQGNGIYNMYMEKGGLRRETIRKLVNEKNLDLGNGWFHLERLHRTPKYKSDTYVSNGGDYTYKGPWFLGLFEEGLRNLITTGMWWPDQSEAQALAFGLGGKAVSATLPTQSHMSLAVSLAELRREGLPKLVGATLWRNPKPSSLGSEYLNYEFGWAPIIRDVVDILKTVTASGDLLREYHRMSGKHIRRKYTFDPIVEVDSFTGSTGVSPLVTHTRLLQNRFSVPVAPQVVRRYEQYSWFSGAYRYALPYGDDFLAKVALWESEANKLLGMRITPEVLYNLTAWTWLLDWFVNIGDVMKNVSHLGRDGLVMHYGYLMQTSRIRADITLPGVRPFGHASEVSERVYLERKMRIQASPYGFGLNPSDFTPKQWAILSALGLSRANGVL